MANNKRTSIEFDQLRYNVKQELFSKKRKLILNDVSGEFRSCELSAVMGASGSGKTSLLNILSGFVTKNVFGSIRVNGEERNDELFKKQSTYIMQEENLHSLLTVHEAMSFAVKFKTGNLFTAKEREEKIISVLRTLGLENKLNFYSGDLSGGERKRLAIAVELVDDPSILFLDEPTTGLDSSSSTQCIKLLKKLAEQGRTIVCTIHTPSALLFEIFDLIYALADGSCIYQGSSKNLVPFLTELDLKCPEIYNPSDFLLEIATNDYGPQNHRLIKKIHNGSNNMYRTSSNNNINDATTSSSDHKIFRNIRPHYSSSFPSQFLQLLYRNFIFLIRDKMFFLMRLAIHLFIASAIGFLYYDIGHKASQVFNIYRFVAITIGFLAYSGFYSLMVRFPLDLPIIKREHFNRWYSPSAYYLALLVSDIPVVFCCCSLFISIIYFLTDQPADLFRFCHIMIIGIITSFTAQSYGLLMGSAFSLKTGLIFASVLMAMHVLFGGFFIIAKDIPSYFIWIFDSTYLKHSIDGAGALIFGYNRTKLNCNEVYCHFQSPEKFMTVAGLTEDLPKAYLTIAATFVVIHFFAFCIMRYRLKN